MDRLVPWAELGGRIAPVYPQRGRGRRPYPLRVMLRIHCLQLWFNLSDPGMEQELYDSRSMLEFAGLSLAEPIPDETTILHFRHLLERHQLGTALFATINAHLAARGLQVREGTIVDSTIISAPSSTKNQARARDPEMHQTRKGRQWFFGMKLHIGTDARTGLVHSVHTTAAHVSDVTEAHRLLHGGETAAWGDAGYQGAEKRPEHAGVGVRWRVAMRPGLRRQLAPGQRDAARAETAQGVGAGEGRASVLGREAALRVSHGALPGPGEESPAAGAVAGLREPVARRAATRGPARGRLTRGAVRPARPPGRPHGRREPPRASAAPPGAPPTRRRGPLGGATSASPRNQWLPRPLRRLFRPSLTPSPSEAMERGDRRGRGRRV